MKSVNFWEAYCANSYRVVKQHSKTNWGEKIAVCYQIGQMKKLQFRADAFTARWEIEPDASGEKFIWISEQPNGDRKIHDSPISAKFSGGKVSKWVQIKDP